VVGAGSRIGQTAGVTESHDDREVDDLHRAAGLAPPRYRRADIERDAGVDHDRSVHWWRAMGFPEVPPDVVAFTDQDVEMVRRLSASTGSGLVAEDEVLRLARLLGASCSRIAEASLDVVETMLLSAPGADLTLEPTERLAQLVATSNDLGLGLLDDALLYVWRRHLLAALGRRLGLTDGSTHQAVGFADISGFSKLSQRLGPDELAGLIDRFETVGFDVVAAGGGRVVKLIGDEVMFVVDDVAGAVSILAALSRRLAADPQHPMVHCGVAFGPTVLVGGDVFGPTVNLASRLTTLARRGTIAVPRDDAVGLESCDDFDVVRVNRTYHLKGIGTVRVVVVRPSA